MSPLLAQNGHAAISDFSPLCAPKQTPADHSNLWVHALDDEAERGCDRTHAGLSEHLHQRRPRGLKARILDNHRVSLCQRVGWVERLVRRSSMSEGGSDTHQLHFTDMMGFARAQSILRTARARIVVRRHRRHRRPSHRDQRDLADRHSRHRAARRAGCRGENLGRDRGEAGLKLIRSALRQAAIAFPLHDFLNANSACQLSKAGAAYRCPINPAAAGLIGATTKKLS